MSFEHFCAQNDMTGWNKQAVKQSTLVQVKMWPIGLTNGTVILSLTPGPEVIKLFFVLSLAEHEILNAHKYKISRN